MLWARSAKEMVGKKAKAMEVKFLKKKVDEAKLAIRASHEKIEQVSIWTSSFLQCWLWFAFLFFGGSPYDSCFLLLVLLFPQHLELDFDSAKTAKKSSSTLFLGQFQDDGMVWPMTIGVLVKHHQNGGCLKFIKIHQKSSDASDGSRWSTSWLVKGWESNCLGTVHQFDHAKIATTASMRRQKWKRATFVSKKAIWDPGPTT